MNKSKQILVAPLNLGIGYATRCTPIINALLSQGHTPILASDGCALDFLRKEFPKLACFELPSYNICHYEKERSHKQKIVWDSPRILKAITKEKRATKKLVKTLQLDGIISDTRLGVYDKNVPCVFITHQLNVLAGNTNWFTSKIYRTIIKKFTECWIPDTNKKPNLSGKLGHSKSVNLPIKYIGVLSPLEKTKTATTYDLMVLLSGSEPQRSHLETKILEELKLFSGRVIFVRGVQEPIQKSKTLITEKAIINYYNFMKSKELQKVLNESKIVLSQSGYTTLLDLAKLEKKAYFIPTPGHYEQKYLAKRLEKNGLVPYSKQENFRIKDLSRVDHFSGLKNGGPQIDYEALFLVFSNVNENSEPTPSTLST